MTRLTRRQESESNNSSSINLSTCQRCSDFVPRDALAAKLAAHATDAARRTSGLIASFAENAAFDADTAAFIAATISGCSSGMTDGSSSSSAADSAALESRSNTAYGTLPSSEDLAAWSAFIGRRSSGRTLRQARRARSAHSIANRTAVQSVNGATADAILLRKCSGNTTAAIPVADAARDPSPAAIPIRSVVKAPNLWSSIKQLAHVESSGLVRQS